ncbi:MAG TPA: hypothetical protein VHM19_17415 [Polyangiales bacterium]|jgi:hypothetical protein|nr:hypothetical protein [Polyangiales bacterium]
MTTATADTTSTATVQTTTEGEQAARIAREEEYWNAPRLFAFGIAFLGACVVLIYVLSCL